MCRVLSNGWVSEEFRILNGVKQGDAISSFLILCAMQVLIIIQKETNGIDCVEINGIKRMMGLFAHDIWNVIKKDEESLKLLMSTFEHFRRCTGLSINYNKTEIMRIGSLSDSKAQCYSMNQLKWTSGPVKVLGIDVYNDLRDMSEYNFSIFKNKFAQKLSSWQYRGLSLIGRNLVVNTLLMSQLVYKMMMVCSMSKGEFLELKNQISQFLWNGSKPKIAHEKLILKFENGGLQLHDLEIKDRAMKLSRIPKLIADTTWAGFMQNFFPILLKLIFKCNINPKKVDKMGISHSFWKQVIKVWAQLTFFNPRNKQQVLAQCLWYNGNMQIPNMFEKKLFEAGIEEISHIYNEEENRFINCAEIQANFNVQVSFLELYKPIQALPYTWRRLLRVADDSEEIFISWFASIEKESKVSRMLYWKIVDMKNPVAQGSNLLWNQTFSLSVEEWAKTCKSINLITLSTKLRLFQYKILQRCLVTNINLYYYKIRGNKLCTFCGKESETIVHLLWSCPKVRQFWSIVFNVYCNQFQETRLTMQLDNISEKIILNTVAPKPMDVLNILVLIAKRYIYITRCLGNQLNIQGYLQMIKEYKILEQYIAKQKNKLEQHTPKWGNIVIT